MEQQCAPQKKTPYNISQVGICYKGKILIAYITMK